MKVGPLWRPPGRRPRVVPPRLTRSPAQKERERERHDSHISPRKVLSLHPHLTVKFNAVRCLLDLHKWHFRQWVAPPKVEGDLWVRRSLLGVKCLLVVLFAGYRQRQRQRQRQQQLYRLPKNRQQNY